MAKEINVSKLHEEIEAAGHEISGVDSTGRVLNLSGEEIQSVKAIADIITAHDPALKPEDELRKEYDNAGINAPDMIFALWNKVMLNDSTDADAIQDKMNDVALSSG